MKATFSIIAIVLLAAGVALAGEPNGVQRGEYAADLVGNEALYVDCLGASASLEGVEYVHYWAKDYALPNGAFHFLFHRQSEVEVHDQAGNTWIGHGEANIEGNALIGEPMQYVARYTFKPVGFDGPIWKLGANVKVTVNANGVVVVDRATDFDDVARCLPTK
jgi:hypothetical protein